MLYNLIGNIYLLGIMVEVVLFKFHQLISKDLMDK